jgi:hypothetical protein
MVSGNLEAIELIWRDGQARIAVGTIRLTDAI